MDWPLPLWQILREELAQLRPAPPPAPPPQNPRRYSLEDIDDITLLAKQIANRERELTTLIGSPEFVGQLENIKTIAGQTGAPPAGSEQAEIDLLNLLLETAKLHEAFLNLPVGRLVQEQNPANQDELVILNRDLIDVAFAGGVRPLRDKILPGVVENLHRAELSALCFSGGGIRSATFNLGAMQALAGRGILGQFDYLSTVSGGGYLGGWLAAWTYWSKGDLPEVIRQLSTPTSSKLEPEADPIFYLRNFSNYLTPRTGLFSADTWTLGATYLRNLLLNWIVLLPLLIALLAVPYLAVVLLHPMPPFLHQAARTAVERFGLALAVLGFACAMFYQGIARPSHLKWLEERAHKSGWALWWLRRRKQDDFLRYCLLPLMVSAFLFATYVFHAYLFRPGGMVALKEFLVFGFVSALLGWSAFAISLGMRRRYLWDLWAMLLSALAGEALFYYLVMVWSWLHPYVTQSPMLYLCVAPPLVLVVFLLAATIFVGAATFWTDDEDREFWSRMGAWILIASFAWVALGAISLFGPNLFGWQGLWSKALSYGGSLFVSAVTAYFGFSAKTPARANSDSEPSSSASIQGALPILGAISIVLILAALAVVAHGLVHATTALVLSIAATSPASIQNLSTVSYVGPILSGLVSIAVSCASALQIYHCVSIVGALIAILWAAIVGYVMSMFIDPNKYSLHAMYRNRLIRAYLGASREKGARRPNPFTGFDPADNIPMAKLWRKQPRKLMPFINMTLNMVEPVSTKLAWQERKAESFTVTPLHSGSFWVGYRPSSEYAHWNYVPLVGGRAKKENPMPITLGTATAISGAAVSPDMGYNSSPIVAMLLTLFNARLGWWLGNPGPAGNDTYMYSNPGKGAKYLLDEGLGRTNDEKPYVYLSDGGHFENLGLYEMVLRRCHTIVVIDAGQDADFAFADLGNAIRKNQNRPRDLDRFPGLFKLSETQSGLSARRSDSLLQCRQDSLRPHG